MADLFDEIHVKLQFIYSVIYFGCFIVIKFAVSLKKNKMSDWNNYTGRQKKCSDFTIEYIISYVF